MIDALIITLREGVEAALIVGITLAYINKIGRADLRKAVFAALAAAAVASVAGAVLLARLRLNEDIFEGWIMLAAAVFVVTMVIFMMCTGRKMKGEIESKLGKLATRSSRVGVFAFVFLMVLREGAETVLMLSAVRLDSTELMSFLGTLIGVALAVVFGVTFVKGSVRINLQKFFKVTTVILFFVAFQLLVSGLHELSENGVLPSSKREMALIGPIVSNETFFFVTILALAGMMILFEYRRRQPVLAADASNAERRKAAWTAKRERLWMAAVYTSSLVFIMLVTAQFIYAKTASALSPATELTFTNHELHIPVAQISGDDLHRFQAQVNGTEVRFLLYKKTDGKVASVLDACEICGSMGFYKSGKQIICKNCAAPINANSLGEAGGCNPIPLKSAENGQEVVVSEADLAANVKWFQK